MGYSDLILPEKMALLLPFWVNHGTHTMPAVFAVLELCLVRHRYPNRITGLSYLIGLFGGYLIYMVSSSVNTGVWPYPFLTELPPAHLTAIISTLIASSFIKYTIGESLHTLIWVDGENQKREECKKRRYSRIEEPRTGTMEIVKEMKGDLDKVIAENKIISHLLENIEEEKVKNLIECFYPAIRNSPELIKKQMLECSMKWENQKEVFMGAISYIVHSRQDGDYKEEQLKDKETEKLSEILVIEIENCMPKFCRKCEEWY